MNLPIYQMVVIKNAELLELSEHLREDMNLARPVVFNVTALGLDEQREVIGVVGNWFETHQVSWRYPYPVYFVADVPEAIGFIPVVTSVEALPRFFQHKDSTLTVKESQVLDKNHLFQQEIKNADPHQLSLVLARYGSAHKKIYYLAREAAFYQQLLKKLRAPKGAHG